MITKIKMKCGLFSGICSVVLLLCLSVVGAQIDVGIEPGGGTIYVNQQIPFSANATSGTPPYSYQWYTQLWSSDPNSCAAKPQETIRAVPGANGTVFNFTENSPGLYYISIKVSDAANKTVYDSFPPGISIKVLPLATTPTVQPISPISPSVPEISTMVFLAILLILPFFALAAKIKRLKFVNLFRTSNYC